MYDITNKQLFEYLEEWVSNVTSYCPQGVKIVVVGNKLDLADEEDTRVVSREEGEKYAEERNYSFFETSAKTNIKVEDAFTKLVLEIIDEERTKRIQSSSQESTVIITEQSENKKKCC